MIIPAIQYVAKGLLKKAGFGMFLKTAEELLQQEGVTEPRTPPKFQWKPPPGSDKEKAFRDFLKQRAEYGRNLRSYYPTFKRYSTPLISILDEQARQISPAELNRMWYEGDQPVPVIKITPAEYLNRLYGEELGTRIRNIYARNQVINRSSSEQDIHDIHDADQVRDRLLNHPISVYITPESAHRLGWAGNAGTGRVVRARIPIIGTVLAEKFTHPPLAQFAADTETSETFVPHEFAHVMQQMMSRTPSDFEAKLKKEYHPIQNERIYQSLDEMQRKPIEYEANIAEIKYLWQLFTQKPINTEQDVEEMFATLTPIIARLMQEHLDSKSTDTNFWRLMHPGAFRLILSYWRLPEPVKKAIRQRFLRVFAGNEPRHPLEAGMQSQPIPA